MDDIRKNVVINVRQDGEGVAEKLGLRLQALLRELAAIQNGMATGNLTADEAVAAWKRVETQISYVGRKFADVTEQLTRAGEAAKLQSKMTEYFADMRRAADQAAQANVRAAMDTSNAWANAYAKMGMDRAKADAKAMKDAEVVARKWIEEQEKAAAQAEKIAEREAAKKQAVLDRWNTKIHDEEVSRLKKEAEEAERAAQKKADGAAKLQSRMSEYFRQQNRDAEEVARESERAADKTSIAWQRAYKKKADESRKASARAEDDAEREAAKRQVAADRLQQQMDAYFARQRKAADDVALANEREARATSEAWRKAYEDVDLEKVGVSTEKAAERFRGLNATIRNLGYGISDVFANNGPLGQKIQGFANNVSFIVTGILQTLNRLTPTGLAIAAGLEIAFTAIGAALTGANIKNFDDLGRFITGVEKVVTDKLKAIEERIKKLNEKPVLLAVEMRELDEAQKKADKLKASIQEAERNQRGQTEEQQQSGHEVRRSIDEATNAKGEKVGSAGVHAALASQFLDEENRKTLGLSGQAEIDRKTEELQGEIERARELHQKLLRSGARGGDALGKAAIERTEADLNRFQTQLALNEKEAASRAGSLTQAAVEGNESDESRGGMRQSAAQAELARRLRAARLVQVAAEVDTSTPKHMADAKEAERLTERNKEKEKADFEAKRKLAEDGQKHQRILDDMLAAEAKAAKDTRLKDGRDWDHEVSSRASTLGSALDDTLLKNAIGMKSGGKDDDAIRATLASSVYKRLQEAGVGGDIADAGTKDQFLGEITEAIMKKFMTEFAGKISARALSLPEPEPVAPPPVLGGKRPKGRRARLAFEARQKQLAEVPQKTPEQRAAEAMQADIEAKDERKADAGKARDAKAAKAMNLAQAADALQQFGLGPEQAEAGAPKMLANMKRGMDPAAAGQQVVREMMQYVRQQEEAMLHMLANQEAMLGVFGPAMQRLAAIQAQNAMVARQINQAARGARGGLLQAFPPQ